MTSLSGWDKKTSPYHRGEQELHARLDRKDYQETMGRKIHRPFMPDQHREFFQQLPFFIAGSVNEDGWPWASILFGQPGFVSSPNNKRLDIHTSPIKGDPFFDNVRSGSPLGFVGVELHSRRRNRVNGVVDSYNDGVISVDIVQSFGNCPQYIQTRTMDFTHAPAQPTKANIETFNTLDEAAIELISSSDTFFVASHNPEDDKYDTGGVDVNHRGGQPGFVNVDNNVLTIPDYMGNFAFNTLGNFLVNPKAGLLFIDFESGDILQLTGTAEVLWEKSPELEAFKGAERGWRFALSHGQRLKKASPLRWSFNEYSPNTLLTGNWSEAKTSLALAQQKNTWKPYHVARIVDESKDIRSFYLAPPNGEPIFDYQPGQFLPIRVNTESSADPILRTYTLSSSPYDNLYRISVKRQAGNNSVPQGVISNFLHDNIKPGDTISAQAPRGSFVFDTQGERPAVLIAGGVGVTPMIAMARAAVADRVRYRQMRPLVIIHATRTTEDRAFKNEFEDIEKATQGQLRYISVVSQIDNEQHSDIHFSGRLSSAMLQRILPLADYEFFLCGSNGFMQTVYNAARELGVNDQRIFAESFGPTSLERRPDQQPATNNHAKEEEADSAVVTFSTSKFEQAWSPEDGTLLEFAEKHGLSPNYGCRNGDCGSCAVKLNSGKVAYRQDPNFKPEKGDVLLCCAVPAKDTDTIDIAL